MVFAFLYLLLCVTAAYLGKNSRLGYWGILVLAVVITPIAALLIVVLFGRRASSCE
jgi:Sec-independent protein secretion pathway component TatC